MQPSIKSNFTTSLFSFIMGRPIVKRADGVANRRDTLDFYSGKGFAARAIAAGSGADDGRNGLLPGSRERPECRKLERDDDRLDRVYSAPTG